MTAVNTSSLQMKHFRRQASQISTENKSFLKVSCGEVKLTAVCHTNEAKIENKKEKPSCAWRSWEMFVFNLEGLRQVSLTCSVTEGLKQTAVNHQRICNGNATWSLWPHLSLLMSFEKGSRVFRVTGRGSYCGKVVRVRCRQQSMWVCFVQKKKGKRKNTRALQYLGADWQHGNIHLDGLIKWWK